MQSVPSGTNTINYVQDNIYDLPVTEVADNLFPATKSTPTLVILTLPKSIKKIGQNAFKDQTKLITISIPGVTHVCKSAFENCTGLRFSGSDKQPKLEIVEDRAFYDARYISFEVSQNFKEIGKEAFYNIYSESITVEGDCQFIDADAFKDCKRLKEIIFYDKTPATLGGDIFSNHITDFRIKVLLDFKDLYVSEWPLYSTIIVGITGNV
ncbi:MAG: leucine-rich repeat domain-containing protein [archaeon]|nr:leucine-rich repeat domain-containing protein [archaeon]